MFGFQGRGEAPVGPRRTAPRPVHRFTVCSTPHPLARPRIPAFLSPINVFALDVFLGLIVNFSGVSHSPARIYVGRVPSARQPSRLRNVLGHPRYDLSPKTSVKHRTAELSTARRVLPVLGVFVLPLPLRGASSPRVQHGRLPVLRPDPRHSKHSPSCRDESSQPLSPGTTSKTLLCWRRSS